MKNWKTTTLGILTILGVVVHIGVQLLNGQFPTTADMAADVAGISTGWGLIHAADSKAAQ
jgi:hypothetical protein